MRLLVGIQIAIMVQAMKERGDLIGGINPLMIKRLLLLTFLRCFFSANALTLNERVLLLCANIYSPAALESLIVCVALSLSVEKVNLNSLENQ